MATPLIGDRPMTATERTRRKRHLDKAKLERLAELEADNARLRDICAALNARIARLLHKSSLKVSQ